MKEVTIGVADNAIPEGYELIAIRKAKRGETYMTDAALIRCVSSEGTYQPVIVLREKRWLPKPGEWYWFIGKDMEIEKSQVQGNQVITGAPFKSYADAEKAVVYFTEYCENFYNE